MRVVHTSRAFAAFRNDERGAVAILGAAFALAAVALAAVVTDIGYAYVTKRTMQGVTDVAALVGARNLAMVDRAVMTTVETNRVAPTGNISVVTGTYASDASLAPSARFVANATPANAVRVAVVSHSPLFFGRFLTGRDSVTVETIATAAVSELATFSIGSRLASLNGGLANAVLGALLGSNVTLNAMDYRALIDARVDVLHFLDALAVRLDLVAGTYQSVLSNDVALGNVLAAMSDALVAGPDDATARAALRTLGLTHGASALMVPARKLADLGPYGSVVTGEASGLAARVSAYTLLSGAILAANGSRQIAVNLSVAAPGVASLRATIDVGEPPQGSSWMAVGPTGEQVYTAQTRVRFDAEVLGSGLLLGTRVRVPILVDVAHGTAVLSGLACGDDPASTGGVTLGVRPGVVTASIGEASPSSGWTDFTRAPTIANTEIVNLIGVARVRASAHVVAENVSDTTVRFAWAEIGTASPKTVSTRTPLQSLGTTLIQNTDLSVAGLGILVSKKAVTDLLRTLIAPVGSALDPVVVGVLDALGINIGEVDVWANGLRCDGAVLVQ